jgi:phage-related baseplate assembly protein
MKIEDKNMLDEMAAQPALTRLLVDEKDGGVFDLRTGMFVESDEAFRKRINRAPD